MDKGHIAKPLHNLNSLTGNVALHVDHLFGGLEGDALAHVVVQGVVVVFPLEGRADERVRYGSIVRVLQLRPALLAVCNEYWLINNC